MKIFMAAVYTNNYMQGQPHFEKLNNTETEVINNLNNILESYHYIRHQKFVDFMRSNSAKVFLDSGAFSAHTLGIEIDLNEYCKYIKRNEDLWRIEDGNVMVSVLDGIGDPLKTYQNQKRMESLGIRPLPCFHAGEDEKYLEYYVNNYDYITLGGMVGGTTKQLCCWLDRIWNNYLVDGSGNPRLKVHAFGITSIPIMERYPWYSVDSSSWIQSASFGSIITSKYGALSVSEKSPSRHVKGQHISTLTPLEQMVVLKHIEDNGFNYERLSTRYESRAVYNIMSFLEINNHIRSTNNYLTTAYKEQGLFND